MSTKYCPRCGAPNTVDSAFCASCGDSLALPSETITSPTAPPPLPPPVTYKQPSLLPDGEPNLNKREASLHRLWQEKRYNELLAAWEQKVANSEKKGAGDSSGGGGLIAIGIVMNLIGRIFGGAIGSFINFIGLIILLYGIGKYLGKRSAKNNLSKYRNVLFYLTEYVSKLRITNTTHSQY